MQSKPYSLISLNKGQLLWFLGLFPFVVMHNVSAMYIQVRGVASAQFGLSALGYFLGLICSATLLPFIEAKIANKERSGRYWHLAVLVILVFPGVFSLIAPLVMEDPHVGHPFLNTFQPFLWALLLPVAFRLFFHPILAGVHGLFFGVVTAAGHLCLAFLIPIIYLHSGSAQILSGTTGSIYLPFLNITRSVFGVAFALIAWRLISFDAAGRADQQVDSSLKINNFSKITGALRVSSFYFLLPLTACFFLYGFLNGRLSGELSMQQLNFGYMHLGLAMLSLLLGFAVTNYGTGVIKKIMIASLLCLVACALCFYFFAASPLSYAIPFLYTVSYKMLHFSVVLACGYIFLQNRNASLTVVAPMLAVSASIPGSLLGKCFLLNLPTIAAICVFCAGCVLSILFVYRFFPLPITVLPEVIPDTIQETVPEGIQKYTPEGLKRFATLHKLNNREIQILEMLLRGLTSIEMVEIVGLKESTVRTYTQNLLKKTGTNSRLELVTVFLTSPGR